MIVHPLYMKGMCKECLNKVIGAYNHKYTCGKGNSLWIAEHPEVNYVSNKRVEEIIKTAIEEEWIAPC